MKAAILQSLASTLAVAY